MSKRTISCASVLSDGQARYLMGKHTSSRWYSCSHRVLIDHASLRPHPQSRAADLDPTGAQLHFAARPVPKFLSVPPPLGGASAAAGAHGSAGAGSSGVLGIGSIGVGPTVPAPFSLRVETRGEKYQAALKAQVREHFAVTIML